MDSNSSLQHFEQEVRRLLAMIEHVHGKILTIALFPALGVAPAVSLGRVLMPGVSPSWTVYDRDNDGTFFAALEVSR
jgi:SMODS-associated and fused to various effectors sensor domain